MRILVIDDEPNIRELLRRVLGAAGHEILDACNGKEGLKLFELEQPDLVIVDMLMPEWTAPRRFSISEAGRLKLRSLLCRAEVRHCRPEPAYR